MTAPCATTILADLAPDEASGIAALLDAGLLPEGWSVRDGANGLRAAPGSRHLAICHPEGHTLSAFETARFQRRIHEALEVEAPLVILLPATLQLPPVLERAMGPGQMQLAPLDRTILLRFLQERFTTLTEAGVRISMDGRGRYLDNIFIERPWQSLKQEAIYLEEITDGFQARRVVKNWMVFYNTERPYSALDRQTPDEAYWTDLEKHKVA